MPPLGPKRLYQNEGNHEAIDTALQAYDDVSFDVSMAMQAIATHARTEMPEKDFSILQYVFQKKKMAAETVRSPQVHYDADELMSGYQMAAWVEEPVHMTLNEQPATLYTQVVRPEAFNDPVFVPVSEPVARVFAWDMYSSNDILELVGAEEKKLSFSARTSMLVDVADTVDLIRVATFGESEGWEPLRNGLQG